MRRIPLRVNTVVAIMLVMLLLPSAVSAMDTSIRVYMDGELLETDHEPGLIDDLPFVSASFVQEQLDTLTVWDSESRTLALERGTYKAQFVVNESHAVVDKQAIALDAPPIVLYNEILLPAEAVGEALGFKVTWDVVTQSLQFYTPQSNQPQSDESVVQQDQGIQSDQGGHTSQNGQSEQAVQPHESEEEILDEGLSDSSNDSHSGIASIGSIEVAGDQIVVKADGILEADVFTLSNPNRLVLDIPNSRVGAMLNGQPSEMYGQLDSTHPYVQRIRYSSESSTVRLVIDLHQPVQFSVIQDDASNQLTVDIRGRAYQVVLDAGHGGKDPGAITYSDYYEKDFTLPLTLKVYELLQDEPLIKPVLTRSDDTFIELDERSAIANRIDADIFLSLHGNTYVPSIHGTESYYYDSTGKYLAETIHRHVVDATGFRDRNVRQQEYKVLRLAEMPAALIEVGYVSNKEQEALLYDDAFQDLVAQAIVDGIKEYLQING